MKSDIRKKLNSRVGGSSGEWCLQQILIEKREKVKEIIENLKKEADE